MTATLSWIRLRRLPIADVTYDLARESGFDSVDDLLGIARHGRGDHVYLIQFHYLPPGAWDTLPASDRVGESEGRSPSVRAEEMAPGANERGE